MAKAKVNLNSLKQTHGALSASLSIEELTGQTERYAVADIESYRQLLGSMSDEEMHEHAVETGVVPIGQRELLIGRLEAKFISASKRTPPVPRPVKISESNIEFQKRFMGGNLN